MTIQEAMTLKPGQIIYFKNEYNADGTAMRWRVSGQVKTWKRDPSRFSVPIKHGLKTYSHMTEQEMDHFVIEEPEPIKVQRKR